MKMWPPFPAPFQRRFSCGNKVDWSGCSRNTMDRIRILRKMKMKACCRILQWSEANMLHKFETFLERSGKIRHKAQKKRCVSSWIGGKWMIIKSWSFMCRASLPSWMLWKQNKTSGKHIQRECQFHFDGSFSTNMVFLPLEAIKDWIQNVGCALLFLKYLSLRISIS